MKIKVNGKIKDVRLPKRFKEKWVKALRSGNYKQGKESLYTEHTNSFCCLGVACAITYKGPVKNLAWHSYIELGEDWSENVPKLLVNDEGIPEKLAKMNDDGKTFKQIAAYIDRYL